MKNTHWKFSKFKKNKKELQLIVMNHYNVCQISVKSLYGNF